MAASSSVQSDVGNEAVKWSGRMKPFMSYRSRYAALASIKERCGSNSSIASSFTGSTQNLLDSAKLMSLQDDARCHKISAEVMKRCLYKPDAPCRRRAYSRAYGTNSRASGQSMPRRMIQSLPVTPMQSLTASPSHSPTNAGGFFYPFLSRGTTPRAMTPEPEEEEEEDDTGLASVLRPQPRYVRALPPKAEEGTNGVVEDSVSDGSFTAGFGAVRRPAYRFRSLNMNMSETGLSS